MADVEQMTIGPGCEVTMHFTLSFTDGFVVDASEPGQPITFTMGDGSLINGLELALYGLKPGDKQSIEIDPLNGFGFHDPQNVHVLPRAEFDASLPLDVDSIMAFSTPSGEEVPGIIKEVSADEVVVDFNHPCAGHDVIFTVEIVDIQPSAASSPGEA